MKSQGSFSRMGSEGSISMERKYRLKITFQLEVTNFIGLVDIKSL